jgi:hypothetical protein
MTIFYKYISGEARFLPKIGGLELVHVFQCNTQYLKEAAADKTVFGKVFGVAQRTIINIDGEQCSFVQHNRDVSVCKSGYIS